ncbi:receptor-interacting serine/threonine-protein kinase 2 isoform X4 [Heptranchias perlo]|uniref:receptor-interacting serine/threonine-protein kinase 2 isoform X4 n=1 Tax=Heptranchias perlo TaxID=212740 RepID=UPI00355A96C4
MSFPMSTPHSVPIISQGDLENLALIQRRAGLMIKARHRQKNVDVSVKILTNQCLQDRNSTELLRDVASTLCIRSKRVLPLMGVYSCPQFLGVVTEWMYNGSLWSLIHEDDLYPNVPVPLRVRILLDVAEGMSCLHGMEPPVLHQTLKSSNVLLDKDYRAMVSDYSLCNWRKLAKASAPLSCVVPCTEDVVYMSPERLQGKPPSTKGDIYSYGMLAFEVLTRRKAYEDKCNLQDLVSAIRDGARPNITAEVLPASLPHRDTLIQLITSCWAQEPQDRPQFKDCVTILRNVFETFDSKVVLKSVNGVAVTKQRILERNKDACPTQLFCIDVKNLEVLCDHKLPLNKKIYLGTKNLDCAGNPIPGNLDSKCSPIPLNISDHQRFPSHASQQKDLKLAETPCTQILKQCRECLIKCMTEGRLNHILDVLRSQQVLTKSDYETITASITRSGRTRALLDTCLCLGEGAAGIVVGLLARGKKVELTRSRSSPQCNMTQS